MVIGAFFSEVGTYLLNFCSGYDPDSQKIAESLMRTKEFTEREFKAIKGELTQHEYCVEYFFSTKKKGTIYVLDEPTTGLHAADISKLITILDKLVEQGNTVIIIEHDIDVLNYMDWVIELGPEGGPNGGEIIAAGTPEAIATNKISKTGPFLKN